MSDKKTRAETTETRRPRLGYFFQRPEERAEAKRQAAVDSGQQPAGSSQQQPAKKGKKRR